MNNDDHYVIEKEISYTINFSQDLLYLILNAYIVKKCPDPPKHYVDVYDVNDVRTRVAADSVTSVRKDNLRDNRFVHCMQSMNALVPIMLRENRETNVPCERVERQIASCIDTLVYKFDDVEIKFEHVYLQTSAVDKYDSTTAHKIVTLKNALLNTQCPHGTQNLQLGSDAILARIRLELEYDTEAPTVAQLDSFCEIVIEMEKFADYQNISPSLPYTTLLNEVVMRKFVREHKIAYGLETFDSVGVKKWALKLDGVRGRGAFKRNFFLMQTDDMQMYSANIKSPFGLNNIVTFQCEVIDNKIVITDLLQVFRYKYNNRTQYECDVYNFYPITPVTAVECLNYLNTTIENVPLPQFGELRFQQFFDPPLMCPHYTTLAIDGFIVLDEQLQYHKYKWMPTVELQYDAENNVLNSIDGPLLNRTIVADTPLMHKNVYECVFTDTVINVIKCRPDRIVPSKVC
ncbi:LEF-4 [Epiphyas postvittana nucleopolyhedrovirus]|uniref:LEF-4 n=1 Tax=Epiphyas postvittana nucleopolyhedrovirus TaxID=70600 RepID=Q91GH5_NPVEP|nr:LEF-4 [Epiphyas postvittana nucleopolyhedrovirus]AAK85642.1 LEF-4 [Epiphyas postvittana nucleopolyhedrovirus]